MWRDGGVTRRVECFFRDSHMSGEGVEMVLHEYTVRATPAPSTRRFPCDADIGALP